ncbi:short-chain dehydrogenases/reductases (SDR) family protein [Abortiporus biennis]
MSQRIWVITGVNSGFGLAVALEAAKNGDKVIGTVRSLSKFPESLRAAGAVPVVIDFNGSDADILQAAKDALGTYDRVDVVVNNVGYGLIGPVEELSVDDVRSNFQVNFFGLLTFTQPFIAHFRERKSGHIINMSSIAALHVGPSWLAYSASKAALDALTDTLTLELKLFNVRVISVTAGVFPTTNFFVGHPNYQADDKRHETNSAKETNIYTDPVTQGYDIMNELPRMYMSSGQVGDPEKLAMRIYELVSGTGLLKDLVPENGGKWEWNRLVLGPDAGMMMNKRLAELKENVDMFEPVWQSTNADEGKI